MWKLVDGEEMHAMSEGLLHARRGVLLPVRAKQQVGVDGRAHLLHGQQLGARASRRQDLSGIVVRPARLQQDHHTRQRLGRLWRRCFLLFFIHFK